MKRMKIGKVLEGFILTIISCTIAMIIRNFNVLDYKYSVGISSDFLYRKDNLYVDILRIFSVFLCTLSNYSKMVLNPLFILHVANKGNDIFFVSLLSLILSSSYSCYGTIIISFLRHLFITPQPGVNLLWLFDSHSLVEFRTIMRNIVISYQLLGVFILRHFHNSSMYMLIYFIYDPCSDWTTISLLFEMFRPYLTKNRKIGTSFALFAFGFVFCQSSLYSWWTIKVGNANFAMIGAIICSVACIIALLQLTELKEKRKC